MQDVYLLLAFQQNPKLKNSIFRKAFTRTKKNQNGKLNWLNVEPTKIYQVSSHYMYISVKILKYISRLCTFFDR